MKTSGVTKGHCCLSRPAGNRNAPSLIVPDPTDKLARRANSMEACGIPEGEMNEIIKKKPLETEKKNGIKPGIPGRSTAPEPPLFPRLFYPLLLPCGGLTEHVGSLNGPLSVGCLRPRISNSSAWKCGIDPKGRPTSASFNPPEIATYVYLRCFHFDGSSGRIDRTASEPVCPAFAHQERADE